MIVLPPRLPLLGEPPDRPPAVVIEFPSTQARDAERPWAGGDRPPRLAV